MTITCTNCDTDIGSLTWESGGGGLLPGYVIDGIDDACTGCGAVVTEAVIEATIERATVSTAEARAEVLS